MRSVWVLLCAIGLLACASRSNPTKAAEPQAADSIEGRWNIVEIRSPVPMIKEAGQIAIAMVSAMDVELAGDDVFMSWDGKRERVGVRVARADGWAIESTTQGDSLFGDATMHQLAPSTIEIRRAIKTSDGTVLGIKTLTLERAGARKRRTTLCLSEDQRVWAKRVSCDERELATSQQL